LRQLRSLGLPSRVVLKLVCVLIFSCSLVLPGAEGSTDVGSSSKEAELLQTIADLRKDLQQAQQQAAQEAGHVAQFRSLAESAEENTKTVQVLKDQNVLS